MVSAAIIAYGGADVFGNGLKVFEEFFKGF